MRNRQKMARVMPVCAAVIAAAALGFLAWTVLREEKNTEDYSMAEETDETDAGIVTWHGKKYCYNDHISNYLFIGVDTGEISETSSGEANAGQADAIYVLSLDRTKETFTVISVPRDTMTRIRLYGPGGKELGTSVDHISLSYAYGDGSHESCQLTKEAVSELLYDLPIQGYCSLSMDAMPVLTETVGSLTVTVPNDSLEKADPAYAEGAQVTLTAENTKFFLQYRDIDVSQSAISRMERQQAFLRAYGEQAEKRCSEDPAFAVELYNALGPYMVTSMGKDSFVRLAQSAAAGQTETGWTVPGRAAEGSSYDEFEADDDALYGKIIETFYEEAE